MIVSVVELSGATDGPLVWPNLFTSSAKAAAAVQAYVNDLHTQGVVTTNYLHPVQTAETIFILRSYCMKFIITVHEEPSE